MPGLTQQTKTTLAEWHGAIQRPGTPERGFTDSGLWTFLNYVYTKDSHETDGDPRKKLPVAEKVYLQIIFLSMLACPELYIPKSRQMMVSWAIAAYAVWRAMRNPHREVVYQTKKEEDAHGMVTKGRKNPAAGRMDFIMHHLPQFIADPHVIGGAGNGVGQLTLSPEQTDKNGVPVPWYGSTITAVPGGADQVRGKTLSDYFGDECAFMPDFGETMAAVNPALKGGGRAVCASSVFSGSEFNAMVLESPTGQDPQHHINPTVAKAMSILGLEWPKGMKMWPTPSGLWVLEVHYTADPEKDPERDGAAWFVEAVKGYTGGVESPKWKREMEIDYEAGGGQPVFPYLYSADSPVFIPRKDPEWVMANLDLYAGYDWGANNPSAFIVGGYDSDGTLYFVWELYEPVEDLREHCEKMKKCPYWKYIKYIVCDPSIMSKTQVGATSMGTIAEQFDPFGISFVRGRRGVAEPMAMRFKTEYWVDPAKPRAFVTDACPNLAAELRGLKYDEHSTAAASIRRNFPETIMDKNNHACDAMFYMEDTRPGPHKIDEERSSAESYSEFIARARRSRVSENPYAIKVV